MTVRSISTNYLEIINMKASIIALALLASSPAHAEIPMYPTVGAFSPMQAYDKVASWTLAKRPRGYLATVSATLRFDQAISDWATCTLPGMTGAVATEKVRFSVGFSETKTVTMTGFVQGTSLQLVCLSEGLKLAPTALDAAMTAVSVDQAVRR